MKSLRNHSHSKVLGFALLVLALCPACGRKSIVHHDYMYVSAPETSLRDRVATMYNKVGTVHNGDRVEVLEKQRRFLRVRTDNGQEGWVEERSLVPQEIYDGFQKLVQDNASTPLQGHGTTRAELNMHLTPARDGEHLYQLKEGEKVEVLKRATAPKNAPKARLSPRLRLPALTAKPASNQKKPAELQTRGEAADSRRTVPSCASQRSAAKLTPPSRPSP